MENIKICPGCKREQDARESICPDCGTDLTGTAIGRQESPAPASQSRDRICPDPQCGAHNSSHATECVYCGANLAGSKDMTSVTILLRWPWGEMRLSQPLNVGRDPAFSPLANDLSSFLDISRVHATLNKLADGSVEIEDRGSKFGTKVGGEYIQGQRKIITSDTEIAFSQNFTVLVQFIPS